MKKIGVLNCIYIGERKNASYIFLREVKIMFKKIISFMAAAACTVSISLTAFAWDESKIIVDTSGAVQIYQVREQDKDDPTRATVYYADKDGNKLDGKRLYGNFADKYELTPRLLLADFEDGKANFVYGFTKSSKGRRYYTRGERAYGWKKIDGYWYHFDTKTGYAATGKTKICGSVYEFDEKGRWTNRVSKSGFAPEDFSVSFSTNADNGFNTAEKKLYYGWTEDGVAEADVKISARDKQILWCMFLESGFELGGRENFDYDYRFDFYISFLPDQEYLVFFSEPETVYTLTFNAGGKAADIKYNTDTEQIALLDEKAFGAWLLNKQYWEYFGALKEKYPYSGDKEIMALE